jgi:purine nucleoside permease
MNDGRSLEELAQAKFTPTRGRCRASCSANASWATWLVDSDLRHRWASEEGEPGAPTFMACKNYETVRLFQLNPDPVGWAMHLTSKPDLKDPESARSYRMRYPQETARRALR